MLSSRFTLSNSKPELKSLVPAAALLLSLNSSAVWAVTPTAEEIFKQSIQMFPKGSIQYEVNAKTVFSDDYSEEKSFLVVKKQTQPENMTVLIRFKQPEDVRCTSILVDQTEQLTERYVYLPAIGRSRLIPESDQKKEMFGLGFSYEDINQPKGQISWSQSPDNSEYYEIEVKDQDRRNLYKIAKKDLVLKEINYYSANNLNKTVYINQVADVSGASVISQWQLKSYQEGKDIYYKIDENTVSQQIQQGLLVKNRIKRCVF